MRVTTTLATPAVLSRAGTTDAYWALRIGAALCFIGHGAFGFITKAGWVPYFAVVGIPERMAWSLMPVVGAVDVLAAMWVLYAPRGAPLLYMTVWATWTALLRPLVGESVWETVERAGNYGVPLALLLLSGGAGAVGASSWRTLWAPRDRATDNVTDTGRAMRVLRATVAALLVGHGMLGILGENAAQTVNYGAVGLAPGAPVVGGWIELALAALVLARPSVALLLFVALWKAATESFWLAAGAPVWETVERAGSIAAPLALAALLRGRRTG